MTSESEDFPTDPQSAVAWDALEGRDPRASDLLAAIPTTIPVERTVGVDECPDYLHRVSCDGEAAAIRFMETHYEYNRWPNCGFVGLVPQRTRAPVLANLLFVGPGLYPPERRSAESSFRVFDVNGPATP